MNTLLKVAVLLSLGGTGYSWQYPRNADQTLWAWRSCQKEHIGDDQALLKKWLKFEIPDDKVTHCFIKCTWIHLGMYDEKTKTIRVDKVKQQFEGRKLPVPAEISKLEGPTDGDCEKIYRKTRAFLDAQMKNYRIAFYGTYDGSDAWFAEHPETKPKNTKISEFCKGREGGKEGTCKHACSMYYYLLVDEDNLVIPFRKLPGISESDLKQCRDAASKKSGCQVADTIYDCLNKINPTGLKTALNTLDEQSLTNY
uniref:24.5 kDa D7-related salivary protein SP04 n=1 Tax=Phlebotomus perniciosus TaxID=13204 RepID=Q0ZS86_PHLPE|nr:24.5 kDa D7-related salivary protein SP04 [Phlebotomus perniciosus]